MSFAPAPLFLALLQTAPNISIDVSGGNGQIEMNLPVQMLILLTLLTFLPSIIITLSSFTRIIIFFHFLRQALGTQESPSSQILIGLALFLSFFVMNPTLTEIYDTAYVPWTNGEDRRVGRDREWCGCAQDVHASAYA